MKSINYLITFEQKNSQSTKQDKTSLLLALLSSKTIIRYIFLRVTKALEMHPIFLFKCYTPTRSKAY